MTNRGDKRTDKPAPRSAAGSKRSSPRDAAGSKRPSPKNVAGTGGAHEASGALDLLRADIDAVDEQLHALLNQRARLAQRAGISKHQDGHTVDYYRPEREAEVLRRALARNSG